MKKNFNLWCLKKNSQSPLIALLEGEGIKRVHQIDYWLVAGERFIGRSSLRPHLNKSLEKQGGHIGYAIRASERHKGYGTQLLQLTLLRAKQYGLEKVLVTCPDQNTGSIRIIESNGGVYQDNVTVKGCPVPERRYWITL